MAGPDLSFETMWRQRGKAVVAGVDEAGRGPWAGPVVAAAVVLDPANIPCGLDDSKVLTERRREQLYEIIIAKAHVGVGIADVARIDRDNIFRATMWAMGDAVRKLRVSPCAVLVDGNKLPPLDCPAEAIVKGDARSASIAAASIIAKVTRDRIMVRLAQLHPAFGWERNKGYGTREHSEALKTAGVTEHHRRSFAPVKALLSHRRPDDRRVRRLTPAG